LRTAEAQIQALATQSRPNTDVYGLTPDPTPAADPTNAIAEACAELMRRASAFHAKQAKASERAMEELMAKLGCVGRSGE
jgi:hypothetical protein